MYKKYIDVVKVKLVKETRTDYKTISFVSSAQTAALIRDYLCEWDRECFIALLLDTKHKLQSIHLISIGSLDMSIVHPREVFKAAILANAKTIIVAHNHPSGDSKPSQEDITTTKRLIGVGEVLGVPVLDHIIVGNANTSSDEYFSFLEGGLLFGETDDIR